MQTSPEQTPRAEPWEVRVSQLRPPAVVCGENVRVLITASIGTGAQFLMSKPLRGKLSTTLSLSKWFASLFIFFVSGHSGRWDALDPLLTWNLKASMNVS